MTNSAEQYEDIILETMNFIESNCEKNLSLESLAERVGVSQYHFHRLFRAYARQPLGEFIRHIRLQKGARILRISQRNVVLVALECGYGSHEAFSRAFSNWAGVSPAQYRQRSEDNDPVVLPNTDSFERTDIGVSEPRLELLSETWFAFKRIVGPYSNLGQAFEDVFSDLARQEFMPTKMSFAGIAFDDPDLRPSDQLRFDAGVVVDSPDSCPTNFSLTRVPQSRCAVVTVSGSYQRLVNGYDRLYKDASTLFKNPTLDCLAILFYRKMPPAALEEEAETEIWLPLVAT